MTLIPLGADDQTLFDGWFGQAAPENRFIEYYQNIDGLLALIDGETRFGFIAEAAGCPVGFADIELYAQDASFAFGIAPALRGRGLGKALLHEIEAFCAAKGKRRIGAGVSEENTRCMALLLRSGYTQAASGDGITEWVKPLHRPDPQAG